jgi:outer membrane lipoprotein
MGRSSILFALPEGVVMISGIRILIVSFSLLFLITGCASVISKPVMDSVDRGVTFQELKGDPERFVGKVVLLGGQIVATTVKKEETWVEVVQKPLDWDKKPEDTDLSYGRFLILFQDFIDPAIYATGREITVAGEVQGKKVLPLNEIEYVYPVILPREHHVWKSEETYRKPRFNIGIGVGGVIH